MTRENAMMQLNNIEDLENLIANFIASRHKKYTDYTVEQLVDFLQQIANDAGIYFDDTLPMPKNSQDFLDNYINLDDFADKSIYNYCRHQKNISLLQKVARLNSDFIRKNNNK